MLMNTSCKAQCIAMKFGRNYEINQEYATVHCIFRCPLTRMLYCNHCNMGGGLEANFMQRIILRSILTGSKSQCNAEKGFHPLSSSKTKQPVTAQMLLFFFSCTFTANSELRGCYAERRALIVYSAGRPYGLYGGWGGGRRTSDSGGPKIKKFTHTPQTRHSSQQDQGKSHASDLSSVFEVCTEKRKVLCKQYKSKPRRLRQGYVQGTGKQAS